MRFLSRFEFFEKDCNKENYDQFMRRWEKHRAELEQSANDTELLQNLLGVLGDGESATINAMKYLVIKGDKFQYVTRIVYPFKRESSRN